MAPAPRNRTERMKGTVRRFYFRKGFGFIEGEPGNEYFFHYSEFTGEKRVIQPGLEVEFETRQGDKGLAATAVRPLGTPPPRAPNEPSREPARRPASARAQPRVQPPAVADTPSRRSWTLPFGAGVAVGAVLGIGTYVLIASGG